MQLMAELELPANCQYEMIEVMHRRPGVVAGQAFDHTNKENVFIKVKSAENSNTVLRMQREADVLKWLDHPQIPTLLGSDTDCETPYIVTELRPHEPAIRRRLANQFAAGFAVSLCISALKPLEYIHQQGITHRDFKIGNLLLNYVSETALVDFELGLCSGQDMAEEVYQTSDETARHITSDGMVRGTVDYISPEQALGYEATPRSDIYSAGIVLYEMLYGRLPFSGTTPQTVGMKHVSAEISYEHPGRYVPDELIGIIAKATQKEAPWRYESAAAMSEDLQRYLSLPSSSAA
jgi:serine/threonine protein kinase